jgi:uncharacterized protein YaaN involved in tellurite resistance
MLLTLNQSNIDHVTDEGLVAKIWGDVLREVSLFQTEHHMLCGRLDELVERLTLDQKILSEEVRRFEAIYEHSMVQYRELEKLDGLKDTKIFVLQTLSQVRLFQHLDQELINKIQAIVLHAVPIWKNQIALALGLQPQLDQSSLSKVNSELVATISEVLQSYKGGREKREEAKQGVIEMEQILKTALIQRNGEVEN